MRLIVYVRRTVGFSACFPVIVKRLTASVINKEFCKLKVAVVTRNIVEFNKSKLCNLVSRIAFNPAFYEGFVYQVGKAAGGI